jgi:hypothetical protein
MPEDLAEKPRYYQSLLMYAEFSPMLAYIASGYQNRFSEFVSKCGQTLKPTPPLPALEWWLIKDDFRTNSVSTNCGVRFEFAYWRRVPDPAIEVSVQRENAKKSYVHFIMSDEPTLHSRFFIGYDFQRWRAHGLNDKTNCIKDVDHVLYLLLQSLKEESQ